MFENKYIRSDFKYKKHYKAKKFLAIAIVVINGLFVLIARVAVM